MVDGHRRFAALKAAGHDSAPCLIREADGPEGGELVDAVATSAQRVDLTPVEEAQAFKRLKDTGYSNKQIASELGVAQKLVTERLKLLSLGPIAQSLVGSGALTPGHVPTLVDMAKVSPSLAEGMATHAAEHEVPAKAFARAPLHGVRHGYVPELEVWIISPHGGISLESVEADLPDTVLHDVHTLGTRRGYPVKTVQVDYDAARAYGCVYDQPETEDGHTRTLALCDRPWVLDAIGTWAAAELAKHPEPTPAEAGGRADVGPVEAPVSEEDQLKAKREARDFELRARLDCHQANGNLAAYLVEDMAAVELSRDVALMLVRMVVQDDDVKLFRSSLGLTSPHFSRVEQTKGDRPNKIVFDWGDSEAQAKAVWEFVERGDTGPEVIGRFLQLCATAQLAFQESMPASSRPGRPGFLWDETAPLLALAGDRVPQPIREHAEGAIRALAEAEAESDLAADPEVDAQDPEAA